MGRAGDAGQRRLLFVAQQATASPPPSSGEDVAALESDIY